MAAKKRSKTVWVGLAVAAILLAAIGVGWVLGSGGGNETPPAATRGASGGPASSTSAEGETDGVCGLPVGSQTVPASGPEATWELKNGMTVPTSKEFGPGIVKDGDRSCFAHNPMGAVFFALNLPAVDPDKQERHLTGKPSEQTESAGTSSVTTDVFTVRGFKVDVDSVDRAVVTIAFEVSGQPGYQSIAAAYEWSEGDWKGVTDDPANTTDGAIELSSLDGYVLWGPK